MAKNQVLSYYPANFDFLSIPAECRIRDWGKAEAAFITNLNILYGQFAALSGDIQTFDPLKAHEAVNASLSRFWDIHHSDLSIPTWNEETCWKVARRYWRS